MNYAQAKAIAADYAPELIPDDIVSNGMLVVRTSKDGMPFSITLCSVDPNIFPPIEARDAVPEKPAIPETDDHPGQPAIPAQPAVLARSTAGQVAEAEKKMLTDALDAAKQVLGA